MENDTPADRPWQPLDTRAQRLLILTAGHGGFFLSFATRAVAATRLPVLEATPWLLWCAVFMGVSAYGLLRCYLAWRAAEQPHEGRFERHERIALKWLASAIGTAIALTIALALLGMFGLSVAIPG